jgi:hypothetical protein
VAISALYPSSRSHVRTHRAWRARCSPGSSVVPAAAWGITHRRIPAVLHGCCYKCGESDHIAAQCENPTRCRVCALWRLEAHIARLQASEALRRCALPRHARVPGSAGQATAVCPGPVCGLWSGSVVATGETWSVPVAPALLTWTSLAPHLSSLETGPPSKVLNLSCLRLRVTRCAAVRYIQRRQAPRVHGIQA